MKNPRTDKSPAAAGCIEDRISPAAFLTGLGLAILMTAFLSACQSPHGQNSIADLEQFATEYAAAWSGQDPEVFASFYAEDASFRINDGEPSLGRDSIRETAGEFMTAFPDMVVELVELRRVGPQVEFHWRWTGTNTGPGGTGNAVDLNGFERWTLDRDGLIVEMRGYMDDAEYQRQLNAGSGGAE